MLRPSQLCWRTFSFQTIRSGMGDMYKGSFTFVFVVKRSMRGCPYSLQMGRRDLSWMVELMGKNVVLAWYVPCSEVDYELPCPSKDLLCQLAYYLRNSTLCFFIYATTLMLSLIKTIESPMIQSLVFKTS